MVKYIGNISSFILEAFKRELNGYYKLYKKIYSLML
jgi:hypothetical protein